MGHRTSGAGGEAMSDASANVRSTGTPAREWFVLVARVVLGALFITAGVLKLRDPTRFAESILAFKITFMPDHLVQLAAFAMPWTEILAGVLLVIGRWTRGSALLVSTMLVMFLVMIASAIYRKLSLSCSCFGDLEFPCPAEVGPCHLIRNGVLLAMGLLVLFLGPDRLALDRRCGSRLDSGRATT